MPGPIFCPSPALVDRHAPRHGVIGYRSPKCPPGRSVEFPRRGTSQVTHVTMVPPRGNETLRSHAMPSACLFTSHQTTQTYSAGGL